MSVFKCKMCGGALEVNNGESVAVCDYCGTKQTLPKNDDNVITNLFNRANNLRLKCEFDKAEAIYDKILEQDNTESEAHWGVILCKYGIEYVEDPKTFERIPTCHRTSYESITASVEYLAALEHADSLQKGVYEHEAKAIDAIQKNILSIVENEKPFDVFLCYKETDENGKRTVDSAIANDIYYQLTQEGFKVFYAAITLEDKLGQEYEPYIFAALNSAKVMLAIGTKPEYFEAVWVKNEWSRFMKLMKTDRSKLLIPCYKDMDAYDLPEDFAHLQAQDMGKIGFINDVVRGLKKVIVKDEPKASAPVVTKVVASSGSEPNTAQLLKRAFMFLEDEEWESADEYCEKALDLDAECAEAYLGKLLADFEISTKEELRNLDEPFDEYADYKKVIRFGNENLCDELKEYNRHIRERNELNRKNEIYSTACNLMDSAKEEMEYRRAATKFGEVIDFKESKIKKEECLERAEEARKKSIYYSAWELMGKKNESCYIGAAKKFESILTYKNSEELAKECHQMIEKIKAEKEAERIEEERKAEEARIEAERKAEAERIATEAKIKRNKKIAAIVVPIIVIIVASIVAFVTVIQPMMNYNSAIALMEEGKYEEAITVFEVIEGYKDSAEQIENCNEKIKEKDYVNAQEIMKTGDYFQAAIQFKKLGNYKDSKEKSNECYYIYAEKLISEKEYDNAKNILNGIVSYSNSEELINECDYFIALDLMDNRNYEEAQSKFILLNNYKDSAEKAFICKAEIIKKVTVGDVITFGVYEQDNVKDNGKEPLEWLVLEKKGNKILLISKYIVERKTFTNKTQNVTWENSLLRQWLNKDFIGVAFDIYEQSVIIETKLINKEKDNNSGKDTKDKVFILNKTEVEKYFTSDYRRECKGTEYTQANGGSKYYKGREWWGMRTLYGNGTHVLSVTPEGSLAGATTLTDKVGVRPAMWIDLSAVE